MRRSAVSTRSTSNRRRWQRGQDAFVAGQAAYLKTRRATRARLAISYALRHRPPRAGADGCDQRAQQRQDRREEQHRSRLQPDHCYVMDRWFAQFALFNEIDRSAAAMSAGFATTAGTTCRRAASVGGCPGGGRARGPDRNAGPAGKRPPAQSPGARHLGAGARRTRKRAAAREARPGRPATASCGSPRTCSMCRPRSSPISIDIAGRSSCSSASSSTCWAVGICFSTDPAGIEIQTYCAIIACLLISLWTGGKPTLRTYEMICHYLLGWADEEELLAHLEKLKPHAAKPALGRRSAG